MRQGIYWLWVLCFGLLVELSAKEKDDIVAVELLVHPNLAAMKQPQLWQQLPVIENAVFSKSEEAVKYVKQGLSCMLLMWDFEAYRHFSQALDEDPDCLLANWGVAFALAGSSGEYGNERLYAAQRTLSIFEKKDQQGNYVYPDLERSYAAALAVLLDRGPRGASRAFQKINEEFPNDFFAEAMSIVLLRQGYDEFGFARPDQEKAEKKAQEFLNKNPEDPLRMAVYLGVHSVMPGSNERFLKQVIPTVKRFNESLQGFPVASQLYGHLAWKAGLFSEAEKALLESETFYLRYMTEQNVSVYDCVERVRSALYAAVAMNSQGKAEAAIEKVNTLAAFEIHKTRIFSPGAVELLWEAKTLQARIHIANQSSNHFNEALESLPKPDKGPLFKENSLFVYYAQSLALYIQGRQAVYQKKLEKAKSIHVLLQRNIKAYEATRKTANRTSSYTQWIRGLRASRILEAELNGFIALAGPEDGKKSALNWFRSAGGWHRPPAMMTYPSIFYPQQRHLGGYLTANNKNAKALEELNEGLKNFPNHLDSLREKANVLRKLGKPKEAKSVLKILEKIEP